MIPGLSDIYNASRVPQKNLGDLVTGFLEIALFAAAFLAFFFLVWGAFAYILARGDKEGLAKARARIMWAVIGLIVIILAFTISQFVSQILPPKGGVPF